MVHNDRLKLVASFCMGHNVGAHESTEEGLHFIRLSILVRLVCGWKCS